MSHTIYPVIVPTKRNLKSYNFYLYQTDQSLIVIDAGTDDDACWEMFIQTLHQHQFSLKDISSILLTHHHIDHIGLVNRITKKHPVLVYAHPLAIPRLKRDRVHLESRIHFLASLYKESGCGNDGDKQIAYLQTALEKNKHMAIQADLLPIHLNKKYYSFKVIHIPGHAPDQVAFFHEEHGWLFSGDLLINHISSNALVEANEDDTRMPTLLQHMKSYHKVMSLGETVIYPGHGTFIKDPIAIVNKRLQSIEAKANKLYALIKEGKTTASQLAKTLYGKKYESQFHLVISEIIGHLDYLETNNRIDKILHKGIYYYQVQ